MAASSPVRVKYLELICAYALVRANMRWANTHAKCAHSLLFGECGGVFVPLIFTR